jgi:hypothetical protein
LMGFLENIIAMMGQKGLVGCNNLFAMIYSP